MHQMPRARTGRPTTDLCRGGSLAPGSAQRGGGAEGSRLPPERPRRPPVLIRRGPGPSRTSGRPPNAADRVGDHVCATSQARACVTRGAISGRQGQCSGSKLSWGALEMGCSAGGGSGSPGCAGRGARWKRGAREPPGLSEAKSLLVVFALVRDTKWKKREPAEDRGMQMYSVG